MKLSLLICTLPQRRDFFQSLMRELRRQLQTLNAWSEVEILSDDGQAISIGEKRNYLLSIADGDYLAFIDDDDRVCPNYIKLLLEGIATNPDACSLHGIITDDGKNPRHFYHSLKFTSWYEENSVYYRYPNHLSTIKSSIAKRFKFPKINTGEDHDWSTQIFKSGLIKSEYWIDEIIYYYDHRSVKSEMGQNPRH